MTDQNWDTDDYKFKFEDVPAYEGELTQMPIHHKMDKVRQYLVHHVLPDMERAEAARAELSAILLGLAAVDYLAGFYVGRQSKRYDYIAFMKRYFPSEYESILEDIYDQLRSGLMHNLVATNPWKPTSTSFSIHKHSEQHLETNQAGRVIFSVGHLRVDIFRAWRMYAYDLIMKPGDNQQEIRSFNRRFNKLDGVGAFMVQVPDD